MANIALCIIATNNYIDFVPALLDSADEYFMRKPVKQPSVGGLLKIAPHDVHYHIFTNVANYQKCFRWVNDHDNIHLIQHEPWPLVTLYRYRYMTEANLTGYDYVYYIDADSLFVAPVGDEILSDLTAVQHPGYYHGGGAWETRAASKAFVEPKMRQRYFAGGFQGGAKYLHYAKILADNIQRDYAKGLISVWQDESHWNALCASVPVKVLDPSYCMVEEQHKRHTWRIDHFQPKIIALAKNHKDYQK